MKTAAEIHADMTSKKLRDDSHETWNWKRSFAGKVDGKPTLQVIEEALAAGHKVKAGYTCTQIRGYHDRWVLVSKKQPFWEDLADKSKDGFRRNLSSPNA